MDIFAKCVDFTDAKDLMATGLYPYFLPLTGNDGSTARYEDREIVMCGSNNYLGLTADPRVKNAAQEAIADLGTSNTGSRFLNGNLELHERLERSLADFYGREEALVFSTGYQANLGAVAGLAGRHDVVLLDKLVHASAIDAAMLSGARIKFFQHNDPEALDRRLAACPPDAGKLVVVDGVYSMEGDICALPLLRDVCRAHGARLVVDDAHALGVLGDGRGTAAHFGGEGADLVTVTFSKSLASIGGAVIGDSAVVQYLRHHARSLIFSASPSPSNAASALMALEILKSEPWRVRQALSNARYVRDALAARGVPVGSSDTPIVPVFTEGRTETFTLWRSLLDRGVYTNPIIPPAASYRLRTSFMATHTTEQLDFVIEAFLAEFANLPAAVS
ncbi:aminotransferase class I/II-fold pyridoxal phosphate-dependent enzyme [Actinokineospora cianjurensis]|uniref:8-amino-7-oxononanoate synthase n=1 Tax=Actinokineospora cianjurensis TaxID=585224 RepID=A0A421AZF3_9PSEU|nr:8-amino-7-oxononanoate synthase [Actinokineospora cianjurensis]RLK55179.1 8-amino-7-oxononanoate synthase [Actinokineospora cianjurensis]